MIIWNTNKLKSKLCTNTFSEKDRLFYLVIFLFLVGSIIEITVFMPAITPNLSTILTSIVNIGCSIIGTIVAYKVNGGNQGHDFLGRYISIGFIVGLKLFIISLLVQLFLSLTFMFVNSDLFNFVNSDLGIHSVSLLFTVIYYWRICWHITDINKTISL